MKLHYLSFCLLFSLAAARPLFEAYQELRNKIAYVSLANLPTPIEQCHNLEKALNYTNIFIKHDDLTGSNNLYGGNKVRKLEFLLAEALRKKAKKIITWGCLGTNHGLATACYCKQLGFECLLMLKNQPNSPVVRQNLLLDHYFNAEIQLFANNNERQTELAKLLANNQDIYFFPTGGSTALGALGYVNAAFELKKQINRKVISEPDFIYLPIGSCGTTAGLLLGLTLANIKTKIVAVAVEPETRPNEFEENTRKLFFETNKLLNELLPEILVLKFPSDQLLINKDFCGTEYGLWMPETDEPMQLMKKQENINLEGTYSAKAFAALIADIKNNIRSKDEVLLFWNTYCGLDFSHLTNKVDYKDLNTELHSYFKNY